MFCLHLGLREECLTLKQVCSKAETEQESLFLDLASEHAPLRGSSQDVFITFHFQPPVVRQGQPSGRSRVKVWDYLLKSNSFARKSAFRANDSFGLQRHLQDHKASAFPFMCTRQTAGLESACILTR